ncbi:3-dehydroquinate synthase [Pyrolobus fumarii 1A]|uniref:Glycerol-1-phosphate dehydrogenase [NAD(P)+] n=1 Tax=Pyrolobus fumarii (strain DSM 11204 / 1A) TaxID=694429 RepID=G0EEX1_PYRF1|nr:NAD(P)-dependent glycerol-1-phosphate dehydrogenase [Pyrolobus fumarii]AEM38085.1 3-dehydroquinate synthase [Pyrolobus fumarii 1A]
MSTLVQRRHEIELPKRILIGTDVVNEVGNTIRQLDLGSNAIIITGPHVYQKYHNLLEESLERSKIEYNFVIVKSSTADDAEHALEEARAYKPSVVIGFGGGKSIDIAKYVAFKLGVEMVSVPTAASHDGIASPFASIKGVNGPVSMKVKPPIAIIADTRIIAEAPSRLLRAGSGDLIAKLTAVRDWKLAHKLKGEYYGEYAASLALLSARHVIRYAITIRRGGIEAAHIVVEGLISSGVAMCIAGSTRPASGSEHLFSHALDMIAPKPALHGEQVAIGTIMMMYLHGGPWKRIRRILRKIGLPTTARELGIKDEYIIKALTIAHRVRPERYTILGESGLTWEAAERIARITGVID